MSLENTNTHKLDHWEARKLEKLGAQASWVSLNPCVSDCDHDHAQNITDEI